MISKDKVKQLRKIKGYSQELLSEKSGLSIRTIQRIEKGNYEITPHTLSAIATALEVENKELVSGNNNRDKKLLKSINLSCCLMLLIPLSNIFVPSYLYHKYKEEMTNHEPIKKVLSFQILWTVITIILMMLIPFLLMQFLDSLRGPRVPLAILVYYVFAIINLFVIFKTSNKINLNKSILDRVPIII